jgi:Ca-activated chloride channel homolog
VKVQVEFNPAQVDSYRLIGYENRVMADEAFNDDRRDAGELGAGHHVTALYEVVPAGAASDVRPRVDPLRYQDRRPSSGSGGSDELFTVKLRYKEPGGGTSRLVEHAVRDGGRALDAASDDFRFAAAVAEWGMLLRRSEHRGEASYDEVLRLARGALGGDPHDDRAGFVRLVQASRRMAARGDVEDDVEEVDYEAPAHEHAADGVIEG